MKSVNLVQFMRVALSRREIVSSWGVSDIEILENVLNFQVDGFNFQGHITIVDRRECFNVYSSRGLFAECHSAIQLLEFLDSYIESGDNYEQKLLKYIFE